MTEVSLAALRAGEADVLALVSGGRSLTVTRDGAPVAEVRLLPGLSLLPPAPETSSES